jgi:hypothetical protein
MVTKRLGHALTKSHDLEVLSRHTLDEGSRIRLLLSANAKEAFQTANAHQCSYAHRELGFLPGINPRPPMQAFVDRRAITCALVAYGILPLGKRRTALLLSLRNGQQLRRGSWPSLQSGRNKHTTSCSRSRCDAYSSLSWFIAGTPLRARGHPTPICSDTQLISGFIW